MKDKVTRIDSAYNSGEAFMFDCPGCGMSHMVPVSYGPEYIARNGGKDEPKWTWNGSMTAPTFKPSLLVREYHDQDVVRVCHSFITDGKIQFLGDCTHALAGQTVDLADAD